MRKVLPQRPGFQVSLAICHRTREQWVREVRRMRLQDSRSSSTCVAFPDLLPLKLTGRPQGASGRMSLLPFACSAVATALLARRSHVSSDQPCIMHAPPFLPPVRGGARVPWQALKQRSRSQPQGRICQAHCRSQEFQDACAETKARPPARLAASIVFTFIPEGENLQTNVRRRLCSRQAAPTRGRGIAQDSLAGGTARLLRVPENVVKQPFCADRPPSCGAGGLPGL